jgi:hypothetical protein
MRRMSPESDLRQEQRRPGYKMGLPVICIDARHAKAVLKMQINKSDRNDAVGIMQCGWYKEVRVKDLDSHAIKALLVSRALLVKIKRDIENQIRGLLKNLGLVIGRAKMNVLAVRAAELADARPAVAAAVEPLLKARDDPSESARNPFNLDDGRASWHNGFGYTYFNAITGLEFSAVSGLTYNFKNPHTGYQNGIDWHVDLEASRFLSKQFYVGAVGCSFNQLTGDSGSGATLGRYISRTSAIGPEVGVLFLVGETQGSLNLRGILGICGPNRLHFLCQDPDVGLVAAVVTEPIKAEARGETFQNWKRPRSDRGAWSCASVAKLQAWY